ncbi:enhanced intracellular survival protein Eis [Kytococcus sedentarius]|uniref:GNAT family N-acetyltransferase n=1 Tax=Kytococcus sedentarius TaxID=1276 RepID=UPI0035BC6CDD
MEPTVRPAREDDAEALAELSQEAFGYPRQTPRSPIAEGRSTWVAEHRGRVVASASCHRYESWWWGQALPTAGMAGVKVSPEARGQGLVRRLFEPLLDEAREWGAVVSTLFATAPAVYRSLGYEVVAVYHDETVVPTSAFAELPPGPDTLRRAVPEDLPALRDTYEDWARQHNGPLTRRGPLFPSDGAFSSGAYTLAEREGRVTGVLRWARTSRYGEPESTLRVHDLVALDADAAVSLLASLGSHAPVAPRTVVSTSGIDAIHVLVPSWQWRSTGGSPYSLAVLDPAEVLRSRAYPAWASLQTTVAVGDRAWSVRLEGGRATVEPTDSEPAVRFTRRGLAVVWSGSQSLAAARQAGLAEGADDLWTLFGAGQVHIRDYF